MIQEGFDNHPAWKDANFEGAERTMLQNQTKMTLIEKLRCPRILLEYCP